MNRLIKKLQDKKENLLTIYFMAGAPELNDTVTIIKELSKSGADIIEIGMPFSDPLADGPTIQLSGEKALKNGMSLKLLFEQLKNIRSEVDIPILLMGYMNPVFKFGIENFVSKCVEVGIDGLILPDLPLDVYEKTYKSIFEEKGLCFIPFITPLTTEERIRKIDLICNGFIYMVSSSSTTGAKSAIADKQEQYFERIKNMKLSSPVQIGFGISNNETFEKACRYANGAIIGSAFINALDQPGELPEKIEKFVKSIKK